MRIFSMNRSICASGSGYVPSDSIGFWVARTRNGSGTGNEVCAIVTCRSCITSSNALCTFAGARLISSASRKLQKTGPSSVSNVPRSGRYTRVPMRSAGTRSGVNWMRANDPPSTAAVVLMVSVFARPGTPSISRCPCASRHTSTRSSMASCPAITRRISKSACSNRSSATVPPTLAGEIQILPGEECLQPKGPLRNRLDGDAAAVGGDGPAPVERVDAVEHEPVRPLRKLGHVRPQRARRAVRHQAEDGLEKEDGRRRRPRLRRRRRRVDDREPRPMPREAREYLGEPVVEVRGRLDHRVEDALRVVAATGTGEPQGDEGVVVRPHGAVVVDEWVVSAFAGRHRAHAPAGPELLADERVRYRGAAR